jgi:hypothetical protein
MMGTKYVTSDKKKMWDPIPILKKKREDRLESVTKLHG